MKFSFAIILLFLVAGCYPEDTGELLPVKNPQMHYINLQNKAVGFNDYERLDVDGNGTVDFSFSTLHIGDPLTQTDRIEFYVGSKIKTNLLNNTEDESPMLQKGQAIKLNYPGYTWYDISAIRLVAKIISNTAPPRWIGLWKEANHLYLPIQIEKSGQLYMGWVELSFDKAAEKLILHRSAIATEAGKVVLAGY